MNTESARDQCTNHWLEHKCTTDYSVRHDFLSHYSLKSERPIIIRLTSLVPAPISYNLASRRRRPVAYSFTYPLPPRHWIACRKNSDPRTIFTCLYPHFASSHFFFLLQKSIYVACLRNWILFMEYLSVLWSTHLSFLRFPIKRNREFHTLSLNFSQGIGNPWFKLFTWITGLNGDLAT